MYLEDKEFDSNNTLHCTVKELERYGNLEDIAKRNKIDVNYLIVQTAQDILTMCAASECLVADNGKIKREVVLPYVRKEYVKPLNLETILNNDADYDLPDQEVDLGVSTIESLKVIKPLYFGVILNEGFEIEGEPISEIFELGFNYLEALVKLNQRGYTGVKILDKNGKTTGKVIKAEPILISLKTEREREIANQADLKNSIEYMRVALSVDKIEDIVAYPFTIAYEQKLVEKQKKEKPQ